MVMELLAVELVVMVQPGMLIDELPRRITSGPLPPVPLAQAALTATTATALLPIVTVLPR